MFPTFSKSQYSNFINKNNNAQSMGCGNSTQAKETIKAGPVGGTRVRVSPPLKSVLEQCRKNPDIKCDRQVTQFPFMNDRLKPVDWKGIVAAGKQWEDPLFRYGEDVLFDKDLPRKEEHDDWPNYQWRRPVDVYGKGNFHIYKTIDPSDIEQGFLGDCYFLSSLSSLAEFPKRIEQIFLNKDVNEAGCYALKLYINGEPVEVVVDDYFPWDKDEKTWAFSRCSKDKEIWVLLIEKAWAKVFGNYMRVEAGLAGEAMPALTGAPAKVIWHDDMKNTDLWKLIYESDQKQFALSTTIQARQVGKTERQVEQTGLLDGHAYALVSCHEFEHEGKQVRLIKARNPWGEQEWHGDWSDRSTKWTPELRKKLGCEIAEDGVFFIAFEDYLQFFYLTTICKYVEGGDLSVCEDEHEPGKYCVARFTFDQDQKSTVILTLNQIHSRFMRKGMKPYHYAPLKIMLCKIVKDGDLEYVHFIDGDSIEMAQQADIELPSLTQGDYLVLYAAKQNPQDNPLRKLVLDVYAPDPVKVQRVPTNACFNQIWGQVDGWMRQRFQAGVSYQHPTFAICH